MKKIITLLLILVPIIITASGCTSAKGITPEEKRMHIADLHEQVVVKMAEKHPEIKQKIKDSPGYGIFSNININLILASAD